MKAGDWVLATKKSMFSSTYDLFLQDFPLGVAQITRMTDRGVDIQSKEHGRFLFKEEDLVLLKEK